MQSIDGGPSRISHDLEGQVRHNELVDLAEESRKPFDPDVVLFVDESETSRKARRILDDAGERYRTLAARGPDIPVAVCGGIVFSGSDGLEVLLAGLAAFDAAFDKHFPRLHHGAGTPTPGGWERRPNEVDKDQPKRVG